MKTIKTKINTFAGKIQNTFFKMKEGTKEKISEIKGGSLSIEQIVWILVIIVVVAVIVLPALRETIGMGFDAVKTKMNEIINFIG